MIAIPIEARLDSHEENTAIPPEHRIAEDLRERWVEGLARGARPGPHRSQSAPRRAISARAYHRQTARPCR